MSQIVFNRYYRRLNPAQKEAVDAIDGPVMVVAGPGTGKTEVLTLRVANILRLTDTPPDAILALTFTKSAAHSMRQRLVEIIGSEGYRAVINTFHGFCNEIIQRYPEEFPRIVGSRNISGVEQIKLMEEVIERARVKILKPSGEPFYHLHNVLAEIERLKKENISPEKLQRLTVERKRALARMPDRHHRVGSQAGKLKGHFVALAKDLAKYQELAVLYRDYEKALRRAKLYDFSDMIMEVVRVLGEKPDFLLQLQEEYHYFLADEHQDANNAQNRLLELLAGFHPAPNLFLVGDEKQAIFQFQGASLENFDYFRRLYPKARLITLTQNYRSSQTILDAAQNLADKNIALPPDRRRPLSAAAKPPPPRRPIVIFSFTAADDELSFVAEDLRQKITNGVAARQIAVLYRDNQDGLALAPYLTDAGVPHVIESESDILVDVSVRKLILLFRAIDRLTDDECLAPALLLDFLRLPTLDVYRLIEESQRRRIGLYRLISSTQRLSQLGLSQPEQIHDFYLKLERWHRLSRNEPLVQLFGAVLRDSEFLASVLRRSDAPLAANRLKALYQEIKNLASHHPDYQLGDFLGYLATIEKHGLVMKEDADPYRPGVRLMTVHRAKGLEFDFVYIINAYEGHFGGKRRGSVFRLSARQADLLAEDPIEPERRLFYVALTRAKRQVFITYAKEDRDGRVRLPSQFTAEIRDDLKTVADTSVWEKARRRPAKLLRFRRPVRLPLVDKSFLNNLFAARGLSVTELNNYLSCPRKYFFLNLLRLVRAQTRQQFYGTAVHAALKDFFDRYRQDRRPTKIFLQRRFRRHLERQPLTKADSAELAVRGEAALAGYFAWYKNCWPRRILNEFLVRGVLLSPHLKIRGRIDKIEFLSARGGREVKVVDYKTGKPKSQREVLGLTKNSSGDLRRQLVFYKLLLAGKEYEAAVGEIDFVEPDERGGYRKVLLEIAPAEAKELGELAQKVAGEITSLSFFRRGCQQSDCRWCRLWETTQARP